MRKSQEIGCFLGEATGQLNSAAIFLDFTSSKKQTKNFEGFLP